MWTSNIPHFTTHPKLYELSEKVGKPPGAIQHLKEKLEDAAFGLTSMLKLLLDKELVTGEDIINTFGIVGVKEEATGRLRSES